MEIAAIGIVFDFAMLPSVLAEFGLEQSFVDTCYREAEEGLRSGEVPVGCVFVRRVPGEAAGVVIATEHNRTNQYKCALKHAELNCIRQVVERFPNEFNDIFKQTVVLLTLEPCIMCCSFLRRFGFAAVLYGAANDRFGGAGSIYSVHNDSRIDCEPLQCLPVLDSARAINLLQRFYDQTNVNAPKDKVIVKNKKRAREC